MPRLISQTKDAIDAMKAAGFKRSEYRCRTECNSRGEYGMPRIIVWTQLTDDNMPQSRIDTLLENGLTVWRSLLPQCVRYSIHSEIGRMAQFIEYDWRSEDVSDWRRTVKREVPKW